MNGRLKLSCGEAAGREEAGTGTVSLAREVYFELLS